MPNHATLRVHQPAQCHPLADAVDSFLDRCESRNLSPMTLRFYRDRLDAFTRYLTRKGLPLILESLSPAVLRDFLKQEVKQSSAASTRHCFVSLGALCKCLVADGWLDSSPMTGLQPPKVPKKVLPVLTEEQVLAMLNACAGKDFTDCRDRAIILTLVDTRRDAHPHVPSSFAYTDTDTVLLTTVKKAEDGDDLILRCWETAGHDTTCTLTVAGHAYPIQIGAHRLQTFRLSRATSALLPTDLLERPLS